MRMMYSPSSPGRLAYARWFTIVVSGGCLTATCACARGNPASETVIVPRSFLSDSGVSVARPATVPGIPALTDVVTVVPFQLRDDGMINVQAEMDGHRGTYILDTGSPEIWLDKKYFRPSATGGIDTVTGHEVAGEPALGYVTVHTLRIGTFVQQLAHTIVGSPNPRNPTGNAIIQDYYPGYGIGTVGLPAMEPFETIIDYVHQRLVLIRLDKKGRRLAAVPAYTPAGAVSLVPASIWDMGYHWWGIVGRSDGVVDTVAIDCGSPVGEPPEHPAQRAAEALKLAIASGQDATAIPLLRHQLLGYTFLRPLAVVGFNLRTRKLILYKGFLQ